MIRRNLLVAGLTLGLFVLAPLAQAQTQIAIGYNGKKGGFGISYTRAPAFPAYPVYAPAPLLPAPAVIPAAPVAPVVIQPAPPVFVPQCEHFRVIYLAPCGRWETFGVYHSHRRAHAVAAQLVYQGIPARVIH